MIGTARIRREQANMRFIGSSVLKWSYGMRVVVRRGIQIVNHNVGRGALFRLVVPDHNKWKNCCKCVAEDTAGGVSRASDLDVSERFVPRLPEFCLSSRRPFHPARSSP